MAKQQKRKSNHARASGASFGVAGVSPALKARTAAAANGRRRRDACTTKEILLAGSGGQGVILAGKMLAQAAVAEG